MSGHDNRQGGAFLILAAVFMLVVLAFLGVVFLTTFTTSTSTSLNEVQSTRALFVAEGGMEFARMNLSLDSNWYWNMDPNSLSGSLGAGQFTADISYPATALRKNIGSGALPTGLPVFSVGRFAGASVVYVGSEALAYTGTDIGPPARFTGITRAQWGTSASAHAIASPVFPATRLAAAVCPVPPCSNLTLTVGSTAKFLWRGKLTLNPNDPLGDCGGGFGGTTEEVDYTSLTGTTFTGVDLACSHAVNEIVVPAQIAEQAGITSTGTVGSSGRQVRSIVER